MMGKMLIVWTSLIVKVLNIHLLKGKGTKRSIVCFAGKSALKKLSVARNVKVVATAPGNVEIAMLKQNIIRICASLSNN